MPECRPPMDPEPEAYLDELEALCDRLAQDLDDALDALRDLVVAVDDADRQQPETARQHLELAVRHARGVLRRVQAAEPDATSADTFLGHLVGDYLQTTDDPDRYFGPGAPDPRIIMAAAIRWGVSEGRLALDEAARIQALIDGETEDHLPGR